MKAVITGATGAIGTALIQELLDNNAEVLVICRRNSIRRKAITQHERVKVIEADLEELACLQVNVFQTPYDVFYHLAWAGTVGNSRNDIYMQNENIRYTLDAVRLAKKIGCRTFVGIGSQAEYGRYEGILSERTPTFPENGYGIAKLCAGQMVRELAHQLNMKYIWTRVFSVYGPHDGMQSMVMSGIMKMLQGVHTSYTAGEQMWDYLYSRDAARALNLLAQKGCEGVYCLASGISRPLKEYIYCIRNCIDEKIELGIGELPYSEKQVMNLQADISKLKQETGFEPMYSFGKGVKETVEWCKAYERKMG